MRRRIAFVSQDPTLLRGTIRYNLTLTDESGESGHDATRNDATLLAALDSAGLPVRRHNVSYG